MALHLIENRVRYVNHILALHRRTTDQTSPIFNPGDVRPDLAGDAQAGLPPGTTLTTLTAGNISMFDTGFQFSSGASAGSAVPGQSGLGTASSPFKLLNVKIDGRVKDISTKYGWIDQSEIFPTTRATSSTALIDTNSPTVPHAPGMFRISQSDLHCGINDFQTNGLIGHGWTSYRNHMWAVVDGLGSGPACGKFDSYVSTIGDWIEYQMYVEGSTGNPGGDTYHPTDGSHCDAWQIQGGNHNWAVGTYFNAQFNNTATSGVTKWIRRTINDDTSAGNGHQYYGTLNGGNGIQMTNLGVCTVGSQSFPRRPVNDVQLSKCWMDGGYNQFVNFSPNGSGGYIDGTDYLNCLIEHCQWGRRFGITSGYWQSGDPAGPSTWLTINTPSGSSLADNIDFGNGVGNAGTNTYAVVGDAKDGTHVGVHKNSNTIYRLA